MLGGLESYLQVFATVAAPLNLLFLTLGVMVGLVVGIIPGLGPTMAVALLIPFTYAMPPDVGMSLLVAVYVGGMSGGFLTAILLRTPGTPASIATILDGYPMAQAGRAGEAVGNAIVANFFGTFISAVLLMTLAPILAGFALKFSFAEYTAVCFFAMTTVAAIAGDSIPRGLVTAILGMLVAAIGLSQVDGLPRYTFGIEEMDSGIGLLPALIGLFAISQLIGDFRKDDQRNLEKAAAMDSVLPRVADIVANTFNYLRSGLIGVVVGVMPALGGGPAGLIAYAQARNASAKPERFGKGAVEGVIASETANNATIGGGLIIALTLGIPGDPTSAVLLGGLMIHGLQPGPQLFTFHPEVLYAIYFSLFLSSLLMVVLLFLTVRILIKVTEVPRHWLQPFLILLCIAGTYSLDNRMCDVGVMIVFGVVGYLLEKLRYPLPPMVLGMVLGPLFEANLRKMLGQSGSLMPLIESPIAATFIVLAALTVAYVVRARRRERSRIAANLES